MQGSNTDCVFCIYISHVNIEISNKNSHDTCFPVAQMVEHGANNTKIMGSIPRESKS